MICSIERNANMDCQALCEQLAPLPLLQYEFFRTEELVFSDRIRHICKTECPMYGTSWACPPAVGTVEECKSKCLSYPEGLLIVTLQEADITDMTATLATRAPHEAITKQVTKLMQAQNVETCTLSTESCAICETCTYPNAPCRNPERMFPCVESHGIVVTALAEKYGIDFYAGNDLVTWFSLILFRDK